MGVAEISLEKREGIAAKVLMPEYLYYCMDTAQPQALIVENSAGKWI